MEKFFAYQKDNRTPCKFGRKCYQRNKEHINKYKHPPTKVKCILNKDLMCNKTYIINCYKMCYFLQDDIKIDIKMKSRKRDAKGKIKSNNSNGESSNINNRNDLNEENQIRHGILVLDDLEDLVLIIIMEIQLT